MSQNPDTVAVRLATQIFPAAIPASDNAGNVQCILLKKTRRTMATVSRFVAGINRPACMRVTKLATGRSHVLHAACPARFSVLIRDARDFAQSPVLHAQCRHVYPHVHTASAPCLVPLHVIIYLVPFAAGSGFPVAINVHRFVEKRVLQASSVKGAPVPRSKNG
jgi:hypothetical protein